MPIWHESRPIEAQRYAVSRYGSQASGVRGAAILMKTVGPGGRGFRFGCIRISWGRRLPFLRLQGAQEATMFSQTDSPPRLRGMTWSTVRLGLIEPQYWHVQPSRARTAFRVMRRRWMSRGT